MVGVKGQPPEGPPSPPPGVNPYPFRNDLNFCFSGLGRLPGAWASCAPVWLGNGLRGWGSMGTITTLQRGGCGGGGRRKQDPDSPAAAAPMFCNSFVLKAEQPHGEDLWGPRPGITTQAEAHTDHGPDVALCQTPRPRAGPTPTPHPAGSNQPGPQFSPCKWTHGKCLV